MHEIYTADYTTPNNIQKEHVSSDAEQIQKAIFLAKEMGVDKTVIPRYNERTGTCRWVLDVPVRLPSNFVLELDNCQLEFVAKGALFICSETEDKTARVQLTGRGNTALCCGAQKEKGPLVQIEHAMQVTVCGLGIQNGRERGILCRDVHLAVIKDIWFLNEIDDRKDAASALDPLPGNAKGIVISGGCDNVTVENIFGTTLGDTVEITTFSAVGEERCESTVRDILVRNVRSDCFIYSNVCVKNGDGGTAGGVVIDGVTDLSPVGSVYRAKAAVSVGETAFGFARAQLGETRNFTVKNVTARGICAVELVHSVQDITIADITVKADGGAAIGCPSTLLYQNIYLCNVKFDHRNVMPYPIEKVRTSDYIETPLFPGAHFYPYRAVCNMRDIHGFNFKINGVYADMLDNLLRITGKNHIELYDVDVENIVYDDFVGDDCVVD